jgi:DNA polymerase-3 subunit alpha
MVGQIVLTAGLVSSVRHALTRDGRQFVSAVLEDFTGNIEVTAWNEIYERTKDYWQEGNTLLVRGKVKSRGDRVQLTCIKVSPYQQDKSEDSHEQLEQIEVAPRKRRLKINIATSEDMDSDIFRLKQLLNTLKQFPGNDEVQLTIITGEGATKLEMPEFITSYGPELHDQLLNLIDEQSLMIEETAN